MRPDDDNPEDHSLFGRMMHDVTPLRGTAPKAPKPRRAINPPKLRRPEHHEQKSVPTKQSTLSDPYDMEIKAETVLCYGQTRLPSKRFRALKQGAIHDEVRLDLHGLRLDAAREALWDFMNKQHINGTRCVLVIHGKGGQHGEASVLKSHVNHWLKQFSHVLAFHSARPHKGGTGAVCVLLKKEAQSS